MLHCPRCSGPLEVQQQQLELRQQQQQPDLNISACPAGNLCPNRNPEQQQQQQQQQQHLATSNKSVNYLSGGGIILSTPTRSQHINQSSPNLLQQPRLLQPMQQQQQMMLLQPNPLLQQQQPLFLTSTIQNPMQLQPVATISTLCQPATPAIVVGSTGNPFHFPQHQACWMQQQQQQPQQHLQQHLLIPQQPVELPAQAIHDILERNKALLEQTNWYYPSLKWNESSDLLCKSEPGTFLVRDSADPNFLFSLSVQRESDGPTSVRIHFQSGKFKLDAEESIRDLMPEFGSVVELIEYYMETDDAERERKMREEWRKKISACARQVFVDAFGKLSSPICLRRPLYKSVPSLAHLARLNTKKDTNCADLPKSLADFLHGYPHKV